MLRGGLRPCSISLWAASCILGGGHAAQAADRHYAIPPQPLASALSLFGRQSGRPILYQEEMTDQVRSPGVVGDMDEEAALALVLKGLPFEYRRAGRGYVVTKVRVSAPPTRATPAASPGPAATAPSPEQPLGGLDEVVVTGTLFRGIAPAGSHVVQLGGDDLDRAGVTQTNQLLATIPQMAGFNLVVRTQTALQGVTGYRPNLRSLPPLQNGTSLVLLDSHNLVGGSIQQNFTDIGALPVGAIEHVEVVLDGGSATYGSDAVGGVLNFITRNHFDGLQLTLKAGEAGSGYGASSVEFLGGRDWSGGGLVVAASSRRNDAMLGGDRDFPRQDLTAYGGSDFRVRTCSPGAVIIGATTYAMPRLRPDTVNLCDTDVLTAITPWERQNSGFLSLSQKLSPALDLQLKAFGTSRITRTPAAQLVDSGAIITSSNPFFQPIGGETQQTLAFSWSPILGPTTTTQLRLRQFDIAPTLTWRVGHGWQVRSLIDYGSSHLVQTVPQLNSAAEAAALRQPGLTAATALNPYNLAATNPAVLNAITNYWNFARSNQSMATARVIADGPLFQLAGGDVRGAVGMQRQRVAIRSLTVSGPVDVFDGAVTARRTRNVSAVFAELAVPLVGPENQRPLLRSVDLDLSARYNRYAEIGSTLDPKIGVTWGVGGGLKLRANWGRAFVAPGLNDNRSDGTDATVLIAATTNSLRPGDPLTDRNRPNLALTGGTPGVEPVTARTWSAGVEYRPPAIDGLDLGLSYWSIEMDNLIQAGCASNLADQLADASLDGSCYFYKPTLAQALALTSGYRIVLGSSSSVANLYGAGNDPYYIQDRRKRNYGGFDSTGLDFNASYRHATPWGAAYLSVGGVRYLTREQQQVRGGPFADLLAANNPKTVLQMLAGADVGALTATVTLLRTGGYRVTGASGQTRVAAFAPLNLFLRYAVSEKLELTLNVDNVADINPPFVNQSGGIAGSTLGRFVSLGLRRRF